jgi:hypothetical protein
MSGPAAVEHPAERSRICEVVLRDLPDWFGIEEATTAHIRDVAALAPGETALTDADVGEVVAAVVAART